MVIKQQFQGRVGRTWTESEPHFEQAVHPAEGAPNVIIVLLDDTGFAHMGCFGSDIDTPNIDRLAANGLQFTNFHVTPLCSPTRAALLTGRNHHAVGMRSVSNFVTGFPHSGATSPTTPPRWPRCCSDEGYATFAVGKWHLCADGELLGRRPVRPVAAASGLRPLLRLHGRRDRPVHPRRSSPTTTRSTRPARPTTATTSPTTWSTRPSG